QGSEPAQLVRIVITVERPTVGHVDGPDPQPAARRAHCARLDSWEPRLTVEPARNIAEAHPRDDRNAVPSPLAVQRDLISERLDLRARKRVVGDLGLLQA